MLNKGTTGTIVYVLNTCPTGNPPTTQFDALNNEPTQYVLPLDSLNGMFMVLYVFLYDKLHCLKVVILILR